MRLLIVCLLGALGLVACGGSSEDSGSGGAGGNDAGNVECQVAADCAGGGGCKVAACVDGACVTQNAAEGTSCDDGDSCTQGETCQAGVCSGGTNNCKCDTDADCTDDGDLCNGTPKCTAKNDGSKVCEVDPATVVTCDTTNDDACHSTVCKPSTGQCGIQINDGASCDDGNPCTGTDVCNSTGSCAGTALSCDDGNPCTSGSCDPNNLPPTYSPSVPDSACMQTPKPGTSCDDKNACTQTDTCDGSGKCVGSDAVVCSALDQCHDVGTCNPSTGKCSDPAKTDGTSCDDQNYCTGSSTCQSGVCVGADPVVCSALDQCHDAGVCNPASGLCSNPPKANGTSCNDGASCSSGDTCQSGQCVGTQKICNAPPQPSCSDSTTLTLYPNGNCQEPAATCNYPPMQVYCQFGCDVDHCNDGTCNGAGSQGKPCNDFNPCTKNDTCTGSGSECKGMALDCSFMNSACGTGVCDQGNGTCKLKPVADGTGCDDANACTQSSQCVAGQCQGSNPKTCPAVECHTNTCNPSTGQCVAAPVADGAFCSKDTDPCTVDRCSSGVCVATTPTDPNEANNTLATATPLSATNDCAGSLQFSLEAPLSSSSDADWYSFYANDKVNLCDLQPWLRLQNHGVEPAQICAFHKCANNNAATVDCVSGQKAQSPPAGMAGCCATVNAGASGDVLYYPHCGSFPASTTGTVYVQVDAPSATSCGYYTLKWGDD